MAVPLLQSCCCLRASAVFSQPERARIAQTCADLHKQRLWLSRFSLYLKLRDWTSCSRACGCTIPELRHLNTDNSGSQPRPHAVSCATRTSPVATWQRPTPNRDEDFVKPSWVPQPNSTPDFRPIPEQPLWSPPPPEFKPAELPGKGSELPSAPKMPERRPDPIPAGNPKKETPPAKEGEKREAPPAKKEAPNK